MREEPIPTMTDDVTKLSDAELNELILAEDEREEAEAEADAANR